MTRKLNKYLKELNYCNLIEANQLIKDNKVLVNGGLASKKTMVSSCDKVTVNGKTINGPDKLIYIAVNKPKRIVTTSDQNEVRNIVSYVDYPLCLEPIGDLPSGDEGIVILTNDKSVIKKSAIIEKTYEKEYVAKVDKQINLSFIRQMSKGVPVLDKIQSVSHIEKIDDLHFRVVLEEKVNNRQLRIMCDYLGYHITRMMRVRVLDDVTVNDLKKGKYRELKSHEIDELKKLL